MLYSCTHMATVGFKGLMAGASDGMAQGVRWHCVCIIYRLAVWCVVVPLDDRLLYLHVKHL